MMRATYVSARQSPPYYSGVREDNGCQKNPIVVSADAQSYGPAVGAARLARRTAMDFCLLRFISLS
jgi:hypothetical protein